MTYTLLHTSRVGYIVTDDREYQPDRCNDGGAYRFTIKFKPQIRGWKVIFGTSADFDYCRKTGWFSGCTSCAYNAEQGSGDVTCVSTYRRTDDPLKFAAEWLGFGICDPLPDAITVTGWQL